MDERLTVTPDVDATRRAFDVVPANFLTRPMVESAAAVRDSRVRLGARRT